MTDKERIDYLYELLGLETSLHTRAGKIAPALNEIELRPFGPRRSLSDRRWGGVELISRNQTPTTAQLKKNNAALKRALNSAEPLQMPRVRKQGAVLCISDPVIVQDMPVDLLGFTEGCIIRVVDNVHGIELSNRSRLYTKHLRNLILEIANADYLEEWSSRVHAIRLADSIGYGFDGTAYDKPDNVVEKRSAIIENVQVRGSDMYFADRPWSNGFHGGLYIENPQSCVIRNFHMQGLGERYTGGDAKKNTDFGIWMEADRLSTNTEISNCNIANVREGIVQFGNGYTGFPSMEGNSVYNPTIQSTHKGIVIKNARYRAPGFTIYGGKISADNKNIELSNIEQIDVEGTLLYQYGHNEPGDCAYIYCDNATSNATFTNVKGFYFDDRGASKDPFGCIMRGFNKELFYGDGYVLPEGADPIEYCVNVTLKNCTFIGKPGTDKAAVWTQSSALKYKFSGLDHENYARLFQRDLAQGFFHDNYKPVLELGGVVPKTNNEQAVITIPVTDGNGDIITPVTYKKVVIDRQDEGAVLMPWSGGVTISKAATAGLIDGYTVPVADPDGYVLDVQYATGYVEFRENYVSGINTTNPLNPVEIVTAWANKSLYGYAANPGQTFRLGTKIAVLLRHSDEFQRLDEKRDVLLRPGEWIEFFVGKNGVEEIGRNLKHRVTQTITGLGNINRWMYDDSVNHIHRDKSGYDLHHHYNKEYISPSDNVFAHQIQANAKTNAIYSRVIHDTGVSGWKMIVGDAIYTNTRDGLESDTTYFLQATIFGKPFWFLRQLEYIGDDTSVRLIQQITSYDGEIEAISTKVGSGSWSAWFRRGAKLVTGTDAADVQPGAFGVGFDENDNLQVWARTSGGTVKTLYADIKSVSAFTSNHKEIRVDTTTGRLVRLT